MRTWRVKRVSGRVVVVVVLGEDWNPTSAIRRNGFGKSRGYQRSP